MTMTETQPPCIDGEEHTFFQVNPLSSSGYCERCGWIKDFKNDVWESSAKGPMLVMHRFLDLDDVRTVHDAMVAMLDANTGSGAQLQCARRILNGCRMLLGIDGTV